MSSIFLEYITFTPYGTIAKSNDKTIEKIVIFFYGHLLCENYIK